MFLFLFSADELTVFGWTFACVALYSGMVFNVLQLSCWSHRQVAPKKTVFPPFLPGAFNHVSGAQTTELFTLPCIIIIITTTIIVLIIITVFLKRKVLPLERIHSYTHTDRVTRTHKHSDHTKLKQTQLKTGSKRPGDLERMKTSERNRKHGRCTILGKEMFLD